MDKAIVTILLIIAGVAASSALVNFVYPIIGRGEGAIVSVADNVGERMKSDIKIIQAASDANEVYVWVKNVGATEITSIEQSDVFFGTTANFTRVPFSKSASPPRWDYEAPPAGWLPATTLKITIYLSSAPSGTCTVKMVIPNGISDETFFGIP